MSLDSLFWPKAVAIIGASRDPNAIGHKVLKSLQEAAFPGPLYPINPKAEEIRGIKCFPSLEAVGNPIDVAVLCVPATMVLSIVEACAKAGVGGLIVITAGFAEVGQKDLQQQLLASVRSHGMRMLGPNCFGMINTKASLNASFSGTYPLSGEVAMASQSGGLGIALIGLSKQIGLGFSQFVSLGNKADISSNDLLEYWEEAPDTKLVLLYLESFGNPRKFAQIAKRITKKKPIIALKSGRSISGTRAAGSHTAALASPDMAVDALFSQAGVLRAQTLEEMFHLAHVMVCQKLPLGKRVGIITNAGGPAILCADACEGHGLMIPKPSPQLEASLRETLPREASTLNPMDLVASAGPKQFRDVTHKLLTSDELDAVVIVYTVIESDISAELLDAIKEGIRSGRKAGSEKPVFLVLVKDETSRQALDVDGERVPVLRFPEEPAGLLAQMVRHREYLKRETEQKKPLVRFDVKKAREILDSYLAFSGKQWLPANGVRELLKALGIPIPPSVIAKSLSEASKAASTLGFPLAMKLLSQKHTHKTEVGGVRLNVKTASEVESIFKEMEAKFKADWEGVLLQPMITEGTEVFIGMTRDPSFGPLVAFGLGGIFVEVISDISTRISPLSSIDAREMIQEIKGARILAGYRGAKPANQEALVDLLLRVSEMAEQFPDILSFDFNPVMAREKDLLVIDARIEVKGRLS